LAFDAYNSALELDDKNEVALIGRGILRLKSKEASSIDDFKRAVQAGTSYVWSHYYYACYLAEASQFSQCLGVSRAGLRRTTDPSTTAEFYEMIAISQYALGESKDSVRANFELARSLAPLNQRIAENHELFRRSLAAPATGSPNWKLIRELDPNEASRE